MRSDMDCQVNPSVPDLGGSQPPDDAFDDDPHDQEEEDADQRQVVMTDQTLKVGGWGGVVCGGGRGAQYKMVK